jgi:hypothetical protein
MPQYDNTNSGALFVNDKQGNDKRPEWRGSLDVNGVQYWISGWERQGRSGDMISLRVEPKQAAEHKGGTANPPARRPASQVRQTPPERQQGAPPVSDDPDDIPF